MRKANPIPQLTIHATYYQMSKKIEFPAVDISVTNWRGEIINEVFLYDEYFYNRSDSIFQELQMNHKIVDSNGDIYVIAGVEQLKGLKQWIPFFFRKRKMEFRSSGEKMSLDELRDFILQKVEELDDNDSKQEWLKSIERAITFRQLIDGQ